MAYHRVLQAGMLLVSLTTAPLLSAQTADSVLTPGRVIRITWTQQGLTEQIATVERFYRDTIFVKARFGDETRYVTESLRILLRDVDRVDFADAAPRGVPSGASGFLIGAIVGGLVGGASLGSASGTPLDAIAAASGVLAGALVGGLIGGVMGAVADQGASTANYTWKTYCTKPCRT